MLNAQFALHDDELSEMRTVAETLHQDARARTVLVIDKNGQLLTAAGVEEGLDTTSLSSLVAANVAATHGIASLIGEAEFGQQFHEGKVVSVHLTIVGRIILVVLFDKSTTQGLVRLRVRNANAALQDILHRMETKPKPATPGIFEEITEDDIDALFG
jgi:predicted regulator of Ras-like GTPase activity (Roadblock/LC7/MglB family)